MRLLQKTKLRTKEDDSWVVLCRIETIDGERYLVRQDRVDEGDFYSDFAVDGREDSPPVLASRHSLAPGCEGKLYLRGVGDRASPLPQHLGMNSYWLSGLYRNLQSAKYHKSLLEVNITYDALTLEVRAKNLGDRVMSAYHEHDYTLEANS